MGSESGSRELSSWKEIAAYLGVGVRTAQVWEQERGLPVRRLPGGRGRVLATTGELDAWKYTRTTPTPGDLNEELIVVAGVEPPVRADQPIAAKQVTLPRMRRIALGSVAAVVVLVLLTLGLRATVGGGVPSSVRVEQDTLIVLDEWGRELWRKTYAHALTFGSRADVLARYAWAGRLGGQPVVIFAPASHAEPTPLICYDRHGRERWRYTTTRAVRSAAESFSPVYGLGAFRVTRLGKDGGDAVLVTMTHSLYYPTQVVLLSADGRVLKEYWHSGHLNHLAVADLDGDGRPEFYLAGINNARRNATLVVLDEDHFSGASAEPLFPDHALQGLPPGKERARVFFPRSCLNQATSRYNGVGLLSINNDQIALETNERVGTSRGTGAGIIYHLNRDLSLDHAGIADSYALAIDEERAAGTLPKTCTTDQTATSITVTPPQTPARY